MSDAEIAIGLRQLGDSISATEDEEISLVEAVVQVGRALERLGNSDANTPMGGLEAHGKAILDSAELIAGAINNLAESVREMRVD